MIEVTCDCGGFLHRKGLDNISFTCVRCGRNYNQSEINEKWLVKFKAKRTIPID